ncbi:hypothetical protein A2U01_0112175, partial [Trifolium medium]|nr:hypothetical protein [Trifolium medium]
SVVIHAELGREDHGSISRDCDLEGAENHLMSVLTPGPD